MTVLYWFSGTGNSLAVARDIARRLESASLVPIASVRGKTVAPEDAVGIVCPVYFYGLPLAAREFLRAIDLRRATYVFVVLTSGGFPGTAFREAQRLLRQAGREPDASYSVTAPGNYIVMYDVRRGDALSSVIARMRSAADEIARDVARSARSSVRTSVARRAIHGLMSATFGRHFARTCRRQDRRFEVTEACTRCGVCARVCPVANIALDQGRPTWLGHCEQCLACIHWCPVAAIQIRGTATVTRGRYHHPEISLEDIASQRGGSGSVRGA